MESLNFILKKYSKSSLFQLDKNDADCNDRQVDDDRWSSVAYSGIGKLQTSKLGKLHRITS
jgi:hypothetical protein